jgi:hypothetical protein
MSYFSHAFHKVFIGNGTVKTTGSTADLTAGDLGFYDYSTFKALTTTPAATFKKMFIIAQGSYHTVDSLSPFFGGLKESVKSRGINPAFIEKLYSSTASDPIADVWTVGYNGVTTACDCLAGRCGNTYTLRIDVKGDATLRTFDRNLYRYITVETPCCGEGCDVCVDEVVNPLWLATSFVNRINTDMQLKNFVQAELIYSVLPTFVAADVLTYTISLSASKTNAEVATAYPTATVTGATGTAFTLVFTGVEYADRPVNGAKTIGGASVTVTVTSATVQVARKLCTIIEGLTNISSAITTFYSGNTSIIAVGVQTTGTSAITYELTQLSAPVVITNGNSMGIPVYTPVPAYTDGVTWGVCPCVADPAIYTGCIGIKLTAAYIDTKFGNCSFRPIDYYNVQPLKIYVTKVDDAQYCTDNHTSWSVTHNVESKQANGLGETVLRDYLVALNYKQEYFEWDPRFREVMDQQVFTAVDRTAKYDGLYLIHSIPNWVKGQNVKAYDEKYVLAFYFKVDPATGISPKATFQTAITNYAALNGVTLDAL